MRARGGIPCYGKDSGCILQSSPDDAPKDVDFDRSEITVRDGKSQKDRATMLASAPYPATKGNVLIVSMQRPALSAAADAER